MSTIDETEVSWAAERRRQSRTPAGIKHTNRKKRNGNLSFGVYEDGGTIILSMSSKSKAADMLFRMLAPSIPSAKLYRLDKSGKLRISIPVKDAEKCLALCGCKPVPEACARCDGTGAITKEGKSASSVWKHGGGAICPACHGSGRAVEEA